MPGDGREPVGCESTVSRVRVHDDDQLRKTGVSARHAHTQPRSSCLLLEDGRQGKWHMPAQITYALPLSRRVSGKAHRAAYLPQYNELGLLTPGRRLDTRLAN